jgi:hypothetical protein
MTVSDHRIAVAIGGNGDGPINSGDLGKGYVHVLTDRGFEGLLTELDTITNLVGHLAAKESRKDAGRKTVVLGPECNLLSSYLLNGKTFPNDADVVLTDDTLCRS